MCKDGKGLNPLVPILQGHWPHPGFSRKDIWPSFPSETWSRAGQRPLISKVEFVLFWIGFSTIYSCPRKGQYCPFPTFVSSLGPFQGAPWERGQDARIGGTVGSGLQVLYLRVCALLASRLCGVAPVALPALRLLCLCFPQTKHRDFRLL